jgi:hypothetical protein
MVASGASWFIYSSSNVSKFFATPLTGTSSKLFNSRVRSGGATGAAALECGRMRGGEKVRTSVSFSSTYKGYFVPGESGLVIMI